MRSTELNLPEMPKAHSESQAGYERDTDLYPELDQSPAALRGGEGTIACLPGTRTGSGVQVRRSWSG